MSEDCIVAEKQEFEDYSQDWKQTFDRPFLIGWLIAFVVLLAITAFEQPELFKEYGFYRFCALKIIVMCVISALGGLLCRHFLKCDEKGYVIGNSHPRFKVNYTRKLQHFAAYIIPLLGAAHAPHGILPHFWESTLVMLAFLLLIKPVREHSTFFMLQFNAMDRPEDRPNTLKWIVLGNLLPALLLGTIFQEILEVCLKVPNLTLIIVLIVGIGDGLAEPVGIHWGKKKYTVPAWNLKKRYVRSYAGSACVFICGLIAVAAFYSEFQSPLQFILALVILPSVMTFAEAYAPHSMDTPIMNDSGIRSSGINLSLVTKSRKLYL